MSQHINTQDISNIHNNMITAKTFNKIIQRINNCISNTVYCSIIEEILQISDKSKVDEIINLINDNKKIEEIEVKDIFFENENIINIISKLNSRIDINIEFLQNDLKLTYINKLTDINNNILFKIKCKDLIKNKNFKNFIDLYTKNQAINTIYFYNDTWDNTDKYLITNNCFNTLSINNTELILNDETINLIQNNNSINSIIINVNSDNNLVNNIVKILQNKSNIISIDLQYNLKITTIEPLINVLQNYKSLKFLNLQQNKINSEEIDKLKLLKSISISI